MDAVRRRPGAGTGRGASSGLSHGETAYQYIRDRIVSGELAPGATLAEGTLAAALGLSRTPIREALSRLSETGLIETAPSKRARVNEWTDDHMRETYSLRALFESHAARLAATELQPEDLDQMARYMDEMEGLTRSDNPEDILHLAELNVEFHQKIVEAAGNRLLSSLMSVISIQPMMVRDRAWMANDFRRRSHHQHADIHAALSSRDPEWAEAAMRSHILSARNSAVSSRDSTTGTVKGKTHD